MARLEVNKLYRVTQRKLRISKDIKLVNLMAIGIATQRFYQYFYLRLYLIFEYTRRERILVGLELQKEILCLIIRIRRVNSTVVILVTRQYSVIYPFKFLLGVLDNNDSRSLLSRKSSIGKGRLVLGLSVYYTLQFIYQIYLLS